MAYPEGTPPHGSKVLTDHIKICEKHPMRNVEAKISKLQNALAALIGASTKKELEAMEVAMRTLDAPESDKAISINAIQALLAVIENE